ncbi:MAG: DUF1566 domain-containing protein [Treponema sp.]|nr:DUF1566 domain-containing protein [Treponema sp.]
MKNKVFIFLLLFLSLYIYPQTNTTPEYFIGGTGPAGGTIFAISREYAWEVSEPLGHMTWDKAFKSCPEYHSGGYNDWYLPTKDELENIYYNLVKPGILDDHKTYWSSNQEESMALWGYNFKKGRPGLYGAAKKLEVRAVRCFTIQ